MSVYFPPSEQILPTSIVDFKRKRALSFPRTFYWPLKNRLGAFLRFERPEFIVLGNYFAISVIRNKSSIFCVGQFDFSTSSMLRNRIAIGVVTISFTSVVYGLGTIPRNNQKLNIHIHSRN